MQRLVEDDPERDAKALARREAIESRQREEKRREAVESVLASVGPRYRGVTLDGYEVYDDRQRAVVERLKLLQSELVEHVKEGRGLFLYGPPGTGKDHLAVSLLVDAAKNHCIRGLRTSGVEIFGRFRGTIDGPATEQEEMRRLVEPRILLISDPVLPFASTTDYQRTILYRAVEGRYERQRSTWITINVATRNEAIELLTAPVFDRLIDDAEAAYCQWPSYRERRRPRDSGTKE